MSGLIDLNHLIEISGLNHNLNRCFKSWFKSV